MAVLYKIQVNGDWTFEMGADALQSFDFARLSPGSFHVLKDHEPFETRVLHSDFNRKVYEVSVNGKSYVVDLSDDLDQLIEEMGFEGGAGSAVSRIEAPMPGLILDIQVSEGDTVQEGDALLVLEAMKMENVILSPRDGVISEIAVARGAAVDKKDLLVVFD